MRVTNKAGAAGGAFAELLQLQTDFQARLADETLRYLRQVQGLVGPSSPGTVLSAEPGIEVKASGVRGEATLLTLEVENRQRVYSVVVPCLTQLVSSNGTTWFPMVASGAGSMLVAPGSIALISLSIGVPSHLPPATYKGALILQGFRDDAIPVTIVIENKKEKTEPARASAREKSKTAASQSAARPRARRRP